MKNSSFSLHSSPSSAVIVCLLNSIFISFWKEIVGERTVLAFNVKQQQKISKYLLLSSKNLKSFECNASSFFAHLYSVSILSKLQFKKNL